MSSCSGAGNDVDVLHQSEVGDWMFRCARQYGAVWRQSGCLGVRIFWPMFYHAFLNIAIEGPFGGR